ncbi:hypothetical protein RBB50_005678 [Rhinocladiella similis]
MNLTLSATIFSLALSVAGFPAPDDAVGAEASPSASLNTAAYTSLTSSYTDTATYIDADADNNTYTDTAAASASFSANVTSAITPQPATASTSAPSPSPPLYGDMFKNKVIIVDDETFLHALEYAASHPAVIADDDTANDNPSNEKRDDALQPKSGKLPKNKKPKMVKWCTPQMDYCTTWYAPYDYYNDNGRRGVERRARNDDWPDNVRIWCSKHDGMCVHMTERVY